MRGSKWANFAKFNFADEQFPENNFARFDPPAHFDPLFSEREKKNQISELISRIGPKSVKISSAKIS